MIALSVQESPTTEGVVTVLQGQYIDIVNGRRTLLIRRRERAKGELIRLEEWATRCDETRPTGRSTDARVLEVEDLKDGRFAFVVGIDGELNEVTLRLRRALEEAEAAYQEALSALRAVA